MSSKIPIEEKLYKTNEAIQAATKSRQTLESNNNLIDTTKQSIRIGKDAGATIFQHHKHLIAIGENAGYFNTAGEENVFIGRNAGKKNRTGDHNVAIGSNAGSNLITGDNNVILGNTTGNGITYGNNNIVVGQNAGSSLGSGSHNVILGNYDIGKVSNTLMIGTDQGNQPLIEGNFDTGVVKIPTLTINNSFTFPTSDGSADQTLTTDGSGGLYWATGVGALSNLATEGSLSVGGNALLAGSFLIHGATTLLSNLTVYGTANVTRATINSAYTLPTSDGTNGQILKTDGGGNLSWEDETGSNTSLGLTDNLSVGGNTTLSGTVNIQKEIIVNGVTTLSGKLHANSDVYIEGNILSIAGTINANSLNISGNTILSGTVLIKSNVTLCKSLSITNNLTIGGNLIVSGNQLQLNVETLNIEDPVIHLNSLSGTAGQNYDIGFMGSYTNGSTYYTGLVRDSTTDQYYLFNTQNYVSGDSIGDVISGSSFTNSDLATLKFKDAQITSYLSVAGNTTLSGTLYVNNDTHISGHVITSGLITSGLLTAHQGVNIHGNSTLSGSLLVTGATTLSNTLIVHGNATLSGNMIVNNNTTLSKSLYVAGNTTLSGTLSMGKSAFISERIEMGGSNIKIGNAALSGNTSTNNVAVGYQAGDGIISGTHTLIGYQSGQNGEGDKNIGIGYQSIGYVSGSHNVAAGNDSMFEVIGHDNVALGASGGKKLVGSRNIIVGNFAAISGSANRTVVMGYQAGKNAITSKSVIIGYQAGLSCTGHDNVFLGYQAGSLRKTSDDTLVIGNENSELLHGNFVSGELDIFANLYISGSIRNPVNNVDISTGNLESKVYTLDLSAGNVHVLNINNSTDISLALTGLDNIVGQRGEIIIDSDTNNISSNYMEFNGSEWAFVSGSPTIYFNNKYDKLDYTVITSSKVVCRL